MIVTLFTIAILALLVAVLAIINREQQRRRWASMHEEVRAQATGYFEAMNDAIERAHAAEVALVRLQGQLADAERRARRRGRQSFRSTETVGKAGAHAGLSSAGSQ